MNDTRAILYNASCEYGQQTLSYSQVSASKSMDQNLVVFTAVISLVNYLISQFITDNGAFFYSVYFLPHPMSLMT